MSIYKNFIVGLVTSLAVLALLMGPSVAIAAKHSAAICTKQLRSSGKPIDDAAKKALIAELQKCIRDALNKRKQEHKKDLAY